jgi:hypothetical protein
LFEGVEVADNELPETIQLSDIDKVKRTIVETGELRVSELGRLLVFGNNKTKELMQELVDEGWLLQLPNKRYQINVEK